MRREIIFNSKRIVLKFGTKIVLKEILNYQNKSILFSELAKFIDFGFKFAIVSSGAVGLGMEMLDIKVRPQLLKKKQALAALGQTNLIKRWNDFLSVYGIKAAQVLLTNDIFEDRKRFLHTKDCIESLFNFNVVPIINENDTVSIDELKFGDNDLLSVLTAILIGADLLIIFSDIDGLYEDINDKSTLLNVIENIDEVFNFVNDKNNNLSMGGMTSKLNAAKLAVENGIGVIIANGNNINLTDICNGKNIGTFFLPKKSKKNFKKKWIFSNRRIKGKVFIDDGAVEALIKNKKSLLPKGIIDIEGIFFDGDIIGIYNSEGKMVGKGVSYYSNNELEKIIGKNSSEITKKLKYKVADEVINRDNLILLDEEEI